MSGGVAYVHDSDGNFPSRVNREMVDLEDLVDPAEIARLRELIERHAKATGSARAKRMLAGWAGTVKRFVKVMPRDYKRMLIAIDNGLARRPRWRAGPDGRLRAEQPRPRARVSGNSPEISSIAGTNTNI